MQGRKYRCENVRNCNGEVCVSCAISGHVTIIFSERRKVLRVQSGGRIIAHEKFNELSGHPPSLGNNRLRYMVEICVTESGCVKQDQLMKTLLVAAVKKNNTSAPF